VKIGIVAGEASGDQLGAKLIHALRAQYPNLEAQGVGGRAMMAAGFHSLHDMERLSVMGLIEPLLHLPDLIKLRRDLRNYFLDNPPDLFIGIDSPDFNLGLELILRTHGIPTIHYVSPSVWAWRQGRIRHIAKAVDLMLTLFPFEKKFYEQHHVPVHYAGHPLAEQIPLQIDTKAAKRALCLDEQSTYIALLPGSRRQEIANMAEPFLLAAKKIWQEKPQVKFLTSHVNEQRYQEFYECYQRYTPDLPLQFFTRRSSDVMSAAEAVMVTSGTATLETMLYKKPMIIGYRMPRLAYYLAKILVKTPYIGLPNLLANEKLVPELIQHELTPDNIARHILDYLDHPEKVQVLEERFTKLHQELLQSSNANTVNEIIKVIRS
jgi:lipid-A-disaccharide synthase